MDFDLSLYRVGQVRTTELYHDNPFTAELTLTNPKWAEKPFELFIDPAGKLRVQAPSGAVVKGALGQVLHLPGASVLINRNEEVLRAHPGLPLADHYRVVRHDRGQLLDAVTQRLDVANTDHNVPVLRISFQSTVPQKAADLVNALGAVYLEDYLITKYKVVNSAAVSITEQLKTVRRVLTRSEDTVEQYRDRKNIVNIKQETETNLREVAELKVQRTNIAMSLAAANDLYRYMSEGRHNALDLAPNFQAFNDMLSTEIVKKIKDLQAERHDLLLRFTPEDEQVKTIDLKLTDLNTYLLESIRNTRTNLQVKCKEIDRAIAQAEGVFVGLPTREKELGGLQRDFTLNEKLYTFLREKEAEAEIAKASPTSYHRIIADGLVPTKPATPNRAFVLVLSGFLGLLIGTILVYLVAMARATPGDGHGVQKETATPLAATLPHVGDGQLARLALFRQLATKLALKGLLAPGTKLVVSVFTDREGQAFVFENLRRVLAAQGTRLRALTLTDADSPNPDAQPDELLLVQNLPLTHDSHALAVMAGATVNLFVLDGPTTPGSRLAELDALIADFQLPNVQLCLNRSGYAPSVLRTLLRRLGKLRPTFRRLPGPPAISLDLQA